MSVARDKQATRKIWQILLRNPPSAPFIEWENQPRRKNPPIDPIDFYAPPGPLPVSHPDELGIGSGIPYCEGTPRLRLDRPLSKSSLSDWAMTEDGRGLWLASERLRDVLLRVDPTAFEFQEAHVVDSLGNPCPPYWLMDIVRILQALAPKSIIYRSDPKYGSLLQSDGGQDLSFQADVIGDFHIFRMWWPASLMLCDDVMKSAIAALKSRRIEFFEVGTIDG